MNYIKMPVVFIALFAAALMTGCFKDSGGEQPAGGGQKDGLTINLSVPGMAAMTRSEYENRIEDLDVIVFGLDGKFVESYAATEIHHNTALTAYQYYIPELELTGDFEIVAVANYPAVVAAALTKARAESGENFTKEQFVQYLEFRAKENNLPYWATNPWNIPMYGETKWEGGFSPATQAVSVELTRAVALMEVRMLDESYDMGTVNFRNLSYNGMLRPNYENPLKPNLPVILNKTNGNVGENTDYCSYYIMESPARDEDAACFCVVVKLLYNGVDNYYRIDMAWDGSIPGTVKGERMPILRNYKYYVNIHKVLGPGYVSLGAAESNDSQLNNLDYTIHVEDSGRFGTVAYDGSYMLGVEETSFDVSADEQIIPIKVSSNHPEYWSVKSEESWLRVSVVYDYYQTNWFEKATSHSALSSLEIMVFKNTDGVERTGKVTVTSGRLSIPITVKQSNKGAVSIEIIGAPYVSADIYSLKWDGTHEKKGVMIKWTPADVELKVNKTADQIERFLYGDDSDLIENDISLRGGSAFFNICPSENYPVAYGLYTTRYTLSVANMGNPLFLDLTYVVSSNCGTGGTPVSQRIGNNDYMTHMYGNYCWMVENSKEGNADATYYGQGETIDDTDSAGNTQHYYTWENAPSACPPGWHLPKYNEHSSLVNAVTNGTGNSPKNNAEGKWWCGTTNGADASTAFTGYYFTPKYGNPVPSNEWRDWGTRGYWWYGTNGAVFEGYANSMVVTDGAQDIRWCSVRCVHDYL